MRLGDLDALYDCVEARYRLSSGEEHKAERALLDAICEMPTIAAIPVEYLMKYAQLPTEFAIAAWRKQDKDAQEKQIKRLDKPMSLDDALNLVNEVFPLGRKKKEAQDGWISGSDSSN